MILAAPRTGSNWLCSLLDSHPEVLCHHELFNPDGIHLALSERGRLDLGSVAERDADPSGLLARAWRATRGCQAVGFKLNRGQSPTAFAAVFADADLRFIVLRRRNRLRTYLSERVARETGEWESTPDRPRRTLPWPVAVAAAEVLEHAEQNAAYYAGLEERLRSGGQARFALDYEDLPQAETRRRLLEFLGVADLPLEAATRRQGARDLRQAIVNFEQLCRELGRTPLAADFHAP